jgi:ribosomal protein L11 methyltransferase
MLREIVLLVEEAHAEPLSDALLAAGALSVAVEDAEADSPAERALYGEPGSEPARLAWRANRVAALLDATLDPAQVVAQAAAACGLPAPPIAGERRVEDADWVRQTQAQFPPTRISQRLWIVPSWHEPPDPDAVAVRLDPGVAFGTGTHPTTRLCLAWLDEHAPLAGRVLDYGCGSGILAIAAAKLGAAEVVGTDIDAQALAAARENARSNGVAARYTSPADLPPGVFDIVLANILANPLQLLAPALLARVAPGGALILSGILERQAQSLIDTYRACDARAPLSVWRADEGWVCLAGTRDG